MGYYQAGFDVIGVDKEPQPNYPFEFYQMDVLELEAERIARYFHAVVGSPPCQLHSNMKHNWNARDDHENLIPPVRDLVQATGLPYIIENVEGAPLLSPVTLCGSSFGLRVRRHRIFETSFAAEAPACDHYWQKNHQPYQVRIASYRGTSRPSGVIPVYGGLQLYGTTPGEEFFLASVAMGIDWMTKEELNQAIPPAYTLFLGWQLMEQVR